MVCAFVCLPELLVGSFLGTKWDHSPSGFSDSLTAVSGNMFSQSHDWSPVPPKVHLGGGLPHTVVWGAAESSHSMGEITGSSGYRALSPYP